MKGGQKLKKQIIFIFVTFIFWGLIVQSTAQFTSEEISEREKWEEFLRTADITDSDQPWEEREAVTRPWRLNLEKDGVVKQAIWKNPYGRMRGFMENWRWEIAAYQLDKHLGLNMVPPTVEKRFKGDRGSCQLMVDYWISLKNKYDQNIDIPSYKVFHWNRALYLQRAFDNLISNEDRHQNQFLITEDWRMILIDHSRSFRTSKKFTKNLIYDKNYKEGPRLMKELPKEFVDRLKNLNYEVIKEITGEYLTDNEIQAVLLRRDLILKEIETIKTVLY
ncbi:MAG: hypothetical protein ACOC57_03040 [Acidobacteriota bacterium]